MTMAYSLQALLDQHGVNYEVLKHKQAFTSQEIAAAIHVSGRQFAKVVMVKIDDEFKMLVLPADKKVDLNHLAASSGANKVELASEDEFKQLFPDCEIGAMPPFGNLYGIEVLIDRTMMDIQDIFFEAGNHVEVIRLGLADFEALVHPRQKYFAVH